MQSEIRIKAEEKQRPWMDLRTHTKKKALVKQFNIRASEWLRINPWNERMPPIHHWFLVFSTITKRDQIRESDKVWKRRTDELQWQEEKINIIAMRYVLCVIGGQYILIYMYMYITCVMVCIWIEKNQIPKVLLTCIVCYADTNTKCSI